MTSALNTLAQIVLYGVACAGLLWLFEQVWRDGWTWVKRTYYGIGHRQLLRVSEGFRTANRAQLPWWMGWQDHLDMLLKATLKHPHRDAVSRFIVGSVTAAVIVGVLTSAVTHHALYALIMFLLAVVTPYGVLHIRRYHLSIRNSYDIGTLLSVIVPEYRKQHGSMLHALQSTVEHLPQSPIRRAVARLTDKLTEYTTPDDARRALDRFVKELGTTWAAQLASDIEHALLDGVDVEYSLALLHKEFQEIEDARKAQNLARIDTLLISCVPFLMWPVMMVLFYLFVSRNIFQYQFATNTGFTWFLLTLIATLGSFIIGITFYKPKQDV
ncbi:MAG: hypothetical protein K6T76_14260 [Alicyclobacillus mali]|uniref:hypothetical protein n=1 Tax=Alicyclobacillus mali (ex Roth et al. 2021) TaxID=1123961 RepID=UPI0023F316A1|nr:hypothetical protein [Alicyclobacillus mali (ex Roth et al. 2021)]MCL6490086.1 hypothetical protein [Alicyclobacillus mali (ex Roth et al. 2021)]